MCIRDSIDVGLVEKADDKYKHTTLGKIAYQLIEALKGALEQKDKLDLVDKLLKMKSFTIEETEEIMRAILKDTDVVPGERLTDILGPVRMADTWEKIVEDVGEYINEATESIYFASRYVDAKTIEDVMKAAQRGVKIYALVNRKEKIFKAINLILRLFLFHPEYLKILFNILDSPELKVRYIRLPYTFIVIDRKIVMIEVVKPNEEDFFLGFFFHNSRLAEKLIESFEKLYDQAYEAKDIIKKMIKGKNQVSS